MQPTEDIRSDETIAKLLSKMPDEVSSSFTEPQLSQLRLVLGARQWGKHKVDLRGTFWHWQDSLLLCICRWTEYSPLSTTGTSWPFNVGIIHRISVNWRVDSRVIAAILC